MIKDEWREPAHLDASRLALALTLAAAVMLRFWGLAQGVPFALGIDEPEVMERAVRMMKTGDFNPHFFDYPSLYIYVQALVAVFRFVFGAMHGMWNGLAHAPTEEFYVWGRAVTAILGTATVWIVYRAGMRWGARTALLAALLLAVMPMHVRESHYVLTDVPATFLVALTLLLSLRARERATARAFALAGAAAGLAGATKYYGVIAVVMPLIVCLASSATRPSRLAAALWTIAATMAAFLIAAPYTVLDLPTFLNQFAGLASKYRGLSTGEPGWVLYLKHLRIALGWTGCVATAIGLAAGALRVFRSPDRERWLAPMIFSIIFFLFISGQHLLFGRYLLPILPFVALFGAWGIESLARGLCRLVPAIPSGIAVTAVLLVVVTPSASSSVGWDINASKVWTSEQAYRWIRAQVPPGSALVIETRVLVLPPPYRVEYVKRISAASAEAYAATGATYLVASSEIFGRYLQDPRIDPSITADYERLFHDTQEVARFAPSAAHPGAELRILTLRR